ncbi:MULTISPECIES: YidC/Oxa1 family membrane protein insertase [Caproicibacterium]|jgi:YidC/Oxa1 family membrane protein insertase|nr:membrane protein insertase YidC [Caproicibacterium lactatifermentans]MDD4807222.1 membrane protein insertase YidC [Oscillospiraceae bacterium]
MNFFNNIFNGLGWLIGYPLYGLYYVVRNYGVAVILFTVILQLLSFPMYIKQQKTMSGSMRMQKKMQELKKIYANDKPKLMEAQQELYEKEGMGGMGSGCLMTLLPMLIFMAMFWAYASPLTNVLHVDAGAVSKAADLIQRVPGDALASTMGNYASMYRQLDIAKDFHLIQPYLTNIFSPYDMQKLTTFSGSFMFLGLNLLQTPAVAGQFWSTIFTTPLFILPFASIALQMIATVYMTYSQKKMGQAQPQQGCMTVFMVLMPLFFGYITCTLPAAMSLYYAVSGLMNLVRAWMMQKYYSPQMLTAEAEGSHVLLMNQREAAMKPLEPEIQQELESRVRNYNQVAVDNAAAGKKKAKSGGQKKNKGALKPQSKSDYMGQKK